MVNDINLDKSYMFNISLFCHSKINYLCLLDEHSIDSLYNLNNFSTFHCLERQKIKNISNYEILLEWAKEKKFILEKSIPTDKMRYGLL